MSNPQSIAERIMFARKEIEPHGPSKFILVAVKTLETPFGWLRLHHNAVHFKVKFSASISAVAKTVDLSDEQLRTAIFSIVQRAAGGRTLYGSADSGVLNLTTNPDEQGVSAITSFNSGGVTALSVYIHAPTDWNLVLPRLLVLFLVGKIACQLSAHVVHDSSSGQESDAVLGKHPVAMIADAVHTADFGLWGPAYPLFTKEAPCVTVVFDEVDAVAVPIAAAAFEGSFVFPGGPRKRSLLEGLGEEKEGELEEGEEEGGQEYKWDMGGMLI